MHWHRVLYLPAGCGDDLAAGVDDEETHDGDANLTDEEQRGHNPAEHCVAEFVEDSGDDQRAAGEQLICDWVHELAQFGDLVIFAGHQPSSLSVQAAMMKIIAATQRIVVFLVPHAPAMTYNARKMTTRRYERK